MILLPQDDVRDSKKSSPRSIKPAERAKKKAWYSAIYPSYKSRSEDFKKLFNVQKDEQLVVGESNVNWNIPKRKSEQSDGLCACVYDNESGVT